MKVALIIQGPLQSAGLTGATWGYGKTRAPDENFVAFDSEKYLREEIHSIMEIFPFTIISTWDHFNTKSLEEMQSTLIVLKQKEPPYLESLIRKSIRGKPDVARNNRYKQFDLINNALDFLSTNEEITHFIKIRTDQKFDWRLFGKEINSIFLKSPKKLFLPYRHQGIPFLFPDFYFGGSIENFRNLMSFIGNRNFSFHNNIHRDMALKTLFLNEPSRHIEKYSHFFLTEDKCSEYICRESNLLFENLIELGSRELFYSMSWRGEKIANQNPNFKFSGEMCISECQSLNSKQVDLKNFLRLNIDSNYNFHSLVIYWFLGDMKSSWKNIRIELSETKSRLFRICKKMWRIISGV